MSNIKVEMLSINDFDHICRTCSSNGQLKSLFDNIETLSMLESFTQMQFSKTDELPDKICVDCLTKINQCYHFINNCKIVDEGLRKCLKDNINQLEIKTDELHSSFDIKQEEEPPESVNEDLIDEDPNSEPNENIKEINIKQSEYYILKWGSPSENQENKNFEFTVVNNSSNELDLVEQVARQRAQAANKLRRTRARIIHPPIKETPSIDYERKPPLFNVFDTNNDMVDRRANETIDRRANEINEIVDGSETIGRRPIERIDLRAIETINQRVSETIDLREIETIDLRGNDTFDRRGNDNFDGRAIEVFDQRAIENFDRRANESETIDLRAIETLDGRANDNFDQRANETFDRRASDTFDRRANVPFNRRSIETFDRKAIETINRRAIETINRKASETNNGRVIGKVDRRGTEKIDRRGNEKFVQRASGTDESNRARAKLTLPHQELSPIMRRSQETPDQTIVLRRALAREQLRKYRNKLTADVTAEHRSKVSENMRKTRANSHQEEMDVQRSQARKYIQRFRIHVPAESKTQKSSQMQIPLRLSEMAQTLLQQNDQNGSLQSPQSVSSPEMSRFSLRPSKIPQVKKQNYEIRLRVKELQPAPMFRSWKRKESPDDAAVRLAKNTVQMKRFYPLKEPGQVEESALRRAKAAGQLRQYRPMLRKNKTNAATHQNGK